MPLYQSQYLWLEAQLICCRVDTVQATHISSNYLPNKHHPEESTWEDQSQFSLSKLEEARALRWIATSDIFWLDADVKGETG